MPPRREATYMLQILMKIKIAIEANIANKIKSKVFKRIDIPIINIMLVPIASLFVFFLSIAAPVIRGGVLIRTPFALYYLAAAFFAVFLDSTLLTAFLTRASASRAILNFPGFLFTYSHVKAERPASAEMTYSPVKYPAGTNTIPRNVGKDGTVMNKKTDIIVANTTKNFTITCFI